VTLLSSGNRVPDSDDFHAVERSTVATSSVFVQTSNHKKAHNLTKTIPVVSRLVNELMETIDNEKNFKQVNYHRSVS